MRIYPLKRDKYARGLEGRKNHLSIDLQMWPFWYDIDVTINGRRWTFYKGGMINHAKENKRKNA